MSLITDKDAPCLYLIPNFIGDALWETQFPEYNRTIIRSLKYFIAEESKSCRYLLKQAGYPDISQAIIEEYNEHHFQKDINHLLVPVSKGHSIGLVSEAGCPVIADPGDALVRLAHQKNIPVVPLIGPSAIMLAIMVSGLNGNNFAFNGYLPIDTHERVRKIRELEQLCYAKKQAQFFIETPYRNQKLLSLLLQILQTGTHLSVTSFLYDKPKYIKSQPIQDWKKTGLPDLQKKPCVFGIFRM